MSSNPNKKTHFFQNKNQYQKRLDKANAKTTELEKKLSEDNLKNAHLEKQLKVLKQTGCKVNKRTASLQNNLREKNEIVI